MLLVICMVFTMIPASEYAAYVKGDIVDNGMYLKEDSDLSYADTITWPIEIYDYANDGMLFEYASATGDTQPFALLDEAGEYVYMPDMTTDYYSDFTKEEMQQSYVVKSWFPAWEHTSNKGQDSATGLIYQDFQYLSEHGGTELIDFRDRDLDGVFDSYDATRDASGNYTFSNAYGYKFSIDAYDDATAYKAETSIILTKTNYPDDGYKYAVKVVLAPIGNGKYKVLKTVDSSVDLKKNDVTWTGENDEENIIMIIHSDGAQYGGYANWMDKIAARALKENDIVTISSDNKTVNVDVPAEETNPDAALVSKENLKYAVLVYRTQDLDSGGRLEAFIRDKNGDIYRGWYQYPAASAGTTSGWTYCVLDFSQLSKNTATNTVSWEDVPELITSAGVCFVTDTTSDTDGYHFMVSHFAMFSTEGEAQAYGEKALVYNNHYVYDNPNISYPDMTTENGANYTTSEMSNSRVFSYWAELWGLEPDTTNDDGTITETKLYSQTYDSVYGTRYYKFENLPGGGTELIDFSTEGGIERSEAKYAVLVYKISGLGTGYATIRAFVRGTDEEVDVSFYESGYDGEKWCYGLFDITEVSDGIDNEDNTSSNTIQSAGIRVNAYTQNETTGTYEVDTDYDFMVSHFALFGSEEEAEAYMTNAQDYHTNYVAGIAYYNPIYRNLGFGFLEKSNTNSTLYPDKNTDRLGFNPNAGIEEGGIYTDKNADGVADDTIYYLTSGNSTDDMKTLKFDGYTLYATLKEGSMTAGLLEGALENGNIVYRDTVIEYLAELLATTLVIPEYEGGRFNYDFIRGEKSEVYADENGVERDLASALRECVGINFEINDKEVNSGSLESAKEKGAAGELTGSWAKCKDNIENCYDAAYYLLQNLFVADSYNESQDTYNYLQLNKTLTSDNKEAYVFDAGLTYKEEVDGKTQYHTALDYDTSKKIIGFVKNNETQEVLADGKALYYSSDTSTTTLYPFLPVTDDNTVEGMTKSPYFADDGVGYDGEYGATYYERDFNYVMKSNGEFVYHEDDGLFFDFEGDDDVYLFINGQLVLDIGGAHGITKESIDINDYVKVAREAVEAGTATDRDRALALEEGGIYSFDFFYMERHGYGANCRIATNMRITDPALRVEKTAYQDNVEINYGGVVDSDEMIEYNFKLENTGNTKLYNITFEDPFIGVALDYNQGLTVSGTNVYDKDGAPLDEKDLTAVITGYKKLADSETTQEKTYKEENGVMVEAVDGRYVYTETTIGFSGKTALINFLKTLEGEGLESGDSDVSVTNRGAGLWVNATVTIKGIYYKLTETQKKETRFDNTVMVTATTRADISQGQEYETLRGQDSHRVFIPDAPYYYQWAGHEIVITKKTLLAGMAPSAKNEGDPYYEAIEVNGLKAANITKIEESTSYGVSMTTSTVSIDADNNITVNYTDPGGHLFYLKVTYTDNGTTYTAIVPTAIYVTEVKDSYTVLDYGLSVDLTEKEDGKPNGVFKYDTLEVAGRETVSHIMGIAEGDSKVDYTAENGVHKITFEKDEDGVIGSVETTESEEATDGKFILNADSDHETESTLTYTPHAFMDEMESIYAAVTVHENVGDNFKPAELGGNINIGKEVQMYKKISVLPANVVYYEDDFPAVTYNTTIAANSFEQIGEKEGSTNLTQSADQDQEYGQDKAYNTNSNMSGDSLQKITIGKYGVVASFEFTGTGFEIISRTNANYSATMLVKVTDSKGNVVKNIPVITEFDNGSEGGTEEIYQVPVIRANGLDYGTYTVSISAMPTTVNGKTHETTLYIDGFRIYQPYGELIDENPDDDQANALKPGYSEYYNDSENNAVFYEIRELIVEAKAAFATYVEGAAAEVSAGAITWSENRNGTTYDGTEWTGNKVSSINDYLAYGPNNEVYMDGPAEDDAEAEKAAIVFYVNEKVAGEGSLQIAVRAIDKGLFEGNAASGATPTIYYGVEGKAGYEWKEIATIASATEQYYTIDYTDCPYVSGKGYQVVIKAVNGMVSYSSIKCTGLELGEMDDTVTETTLKFENGVLVDPETGDEPAGVPALYSLRTMLASNAFYEEEISVDEKICYQVRNDSDVRLIGFVDDLSNYESVSFTLTIDGKTSKELVCKTAYSTLYANGVPHSTEDIYGVDGYFVTFTINNYLKAYRGPVKITITYTSVTGDVHTEARTVTIE